MLGLLISIAMSIENVFTDISRKKVLDQGYNSILISFWAKIAAFSCYVVLVAALASMGMKFALPAIGAKFGMTTGVAFFLYLLINMLVEGTAILLNLKALQVSPLSFCVPFMALTPLFLLPAGRIFLGEAITPIMVVGVSLIVIGSLVMNRKLVANGWLEPLKEILRQKGSRYMTLVALLLTGSVILDKWFVTLTPLADAAVADKIRAGLPIAVVLAVSKCVVHACFFAGLVLFRVIDWKTLRNSSLTFGEKLKTPAWLKVWQDKPGWMFLAGALESLGLVLQFIAIQFTVAALVISIKRCGVVLSVILGKFVFHEKDITDRLIASAVMLAGVILFSCNNFITLRLALILAASALALMTLALYWTRPAGKGKN